MPDSCYFKRVDKLLYPFIWKNGPDRIKRSVIRPGKKLWFLSIDFKYQVQLKKTFPMFQES